MRAQRVLIHPGLHRTGTTFIQRVVLPAMLKPDNFVGPDHPFTDFLMGRIAEEPYVNFVDNMVISREGLTGSIEKRSDLYLSRLPKHLFPTFVITIRQPIELLISIYLHNYSKYGNKRFLDVCKYSLIERINLKQIEFDVRSRFPNSEIFYLSLDQLDHDPFHYHKFFSNYLNVNLDWMKPEPSPVNKRGNTKELLERISSRLGGQCEYTEREFEDDIASVASIPEFLEVEEAYKARLLGVC